MCKWIRFDHYMVSTPLLFSQTYGFQKYSKAFRISGSPASYHKVAKQKHTTRVCLVSRCGDNGLSTHQSLQHKGFLTTFQRLHERQWVAIPNAKQCQKREDLGIGGILINALQNKGILGYLSRSAPFRFGILKLALKC